MPLFYFMTEKNKIFFGILTVEGNRSFLLNKKGVPLLEKELIWEGYIKHWSGKKINARKLPLKDYKKNEAIIICWPEKKYPNEPFIELYYNERLIKYPTSRLGHIAININNNIFNFSHLINENEIISSEEYFYRPALGEFAPHPETGIFNIDDKDRPYFDKFGRNFMRTIHVLRIEGIDTEKLLNFYKNELEVIYNTPRDPESPEDYRDFNIFKRSCTTIIRDGFKECGFKKIKGTFPRDLFINAAYHFARTYKKDSIKVKLYKMDQLKVPEAPFSKITPLLNPFNKLREYYLKRQFPDFFKDRNNH